MNGFRMSTSPSTNSVYEQILAELLAMEYEVPPALVAGLQCASEERGRLKCTSNQTDGRVQPEQISFLRTVRSQLCRAS